MGGASLLKRGDEEAEFQRTRNHLPAVLRGQDPDGGCGVHRDLSGAGIKAGEECT